MKLVKQVQLTLSGRIEKIYEIDLCEVGDGEYVVNFRYGRRGRALQDGSMTPLPVDRAQAERVFSQTVRARKAKGYVDPSAPAAPAPGAKPKRARTSGRSRQELAARRQRDIVFRLRAGDAKYPEWPLNRAIWRAGELGLGDAEPELLRYLTASHSNNLRRYSAIWALGRAGSRAAVDPIVKVYEDAGAPAFLRRMAAEALRRLLSKPELAGLIEREQKSLPEPLAELAATGPSADLQDALQQLVANDRHSALATVLGAYFIDNEHTRPAVLRFCSEASVGGDFRILRALYKAAEYRRDAQVFGLIAYRIESTPAEHSERGDGRPTRARPFSTQTRDYYRWRTWRTLRRLGQAEDADWSRMAVGVLQQYTDADAQEIERHWALCQLLYLNSRRYRPDKRQRGFVLVDRRAGGGEREEAFPELWDRAPQALLHLLDGSACERVHEFAVRALRHNTSFLSQLDVPAVVMLLGRPYQVTAALGFELAKQHYDPFAPDRDLLLALVGSVHAPARAEGRSYIDAQRSLVTGDSAFLCALAMSPHADTRAFALNLLKGSALDDDVGRALVGRLVAELLALGSELDDRVPDVSDILLRALTPYITSLGSDVLRDLVGHPMARLQELGGDLLLANPALRERVPSDLLFALLSGENQAVRVVGMRLLSALGDGDLAERPELLFSLATSQHEDLRNSVKPIIGRVAPAYPGLAQALGGLLLERLRFKAEPQLHAFVAQLLESELADFLGSLPKEEVLRLLNSRFAHAQELGGKLLGRNVAPDALGIAEIVRLSNHEIRSVREASWRLCDKNAQRLVLAADKAMRLLDSKWEDSREFAFGFFRRHFDETTLTPTLLVSICDSTRPEVQQFGRELVTKYFDPKYGPEYLQKFSEHPSEALQLFATNYLERFAAGQPERLGALIPYFAAVLSRVNRGRLAKIRVLAFLEREALASREAAVIIAPLLARQSATISIENKAALLQCMVRINEQYPDIALPIELVPPAQREAPCAV